MAKWTLPLLVLGMVVFPVGGISWGQTVPVAPSAPTCSWDSSGTRSTCKFKDTMAGTPTSVVGNRVILFNRSVSGGHAQSRGYLKASVERLAARYGFTATITEDPAVFTAANLADAKVVIMSNGDGDVVPPGANRVALENFQQVNGWGVIWIHAACAFITSGWPFGQQSCVQQYYRMNGPGTTRRMFIDSGTSASPNHGIRNPQSEFFLRNLPGWSGNRVLELADEWYCFRATVRDSAGVNVLFGFDRSSGLPGGGCPHAGYHDDTTAVASHFHNMAWSRRMGRGITLFNPWGHDKAAYTSHGNMGDSLLWRFIRYAAKDWCVSGSGEPGCDGPLAIRASKAIPETYPLQRNGGITFSLPDAGRFTVSAMDVAGRPVFSRSVNGPGKVEIPGLRRGLYLVRVNGEGTSRTHRVMVY